jgi:subtilase family serine protease
MNWRVRTGMLPAGTALAVLAAMSTGGAAMAAPPIHLSHAKAHLSHTMTPPLMIKSFGRLASGKLRFAATTPTGLPPSAVASVYNLSGLSAASGAGAGQIIAIVDAFHDPNALSDLNTWNSQYGYPALSACTSLQQAGACFEQADPQGTPTVNKGWVLEESLDIEWAHAEAPGAKIVLVEAASASDADLFGAAQYAGSTLGATEVSMSFGGTDAAGDSSFDSDLANPGTLYTASAGDSGNGAEYPASSPNVIAVGGTTLNGCSGTSCAGAAAGQTTLAGDSAIYSGGSANLRDITSGSNGSCGTDCTAGPGYDLVTGLGSPVNYP